MTPTPPSRDGSSDGTKNFPPSDSVFNFHDERPRIDISDDIKLVYVGEHRWSIEGIEYPYIEIHRGEELLTSRRLRTFRNLLAERLGINIGDVKRRLASIAKRIDELYTELHARERDAERAEEILEEKPPWMLNAELLEEARRWVEGRLEEIQRLPYPDCIHKYHDLLKDCLKDILAGEESNKVCAFVIIGFGSNYILLLLGKSSIGKNLILDAFVPLVPNYTRNRLTEHALDYLDPDKVKGKVIYVREIISVKEHSLFIKSIEVSEGQLWYRIDYVRRNPITNELETVTHRVPIKAFISTSNREEIDVAGLAERTFFLRMDDSIEQDRRVGEFKSRISAQEEEVKLGLRPWTDQEWSLARVYWLHRFALSVEEPILLPHVESLEKVITEKLAPAFPNEVRRICSRAKHFLKWFGRCFSPVLPIVSLNGKKYRLMDTETLKVGLQYFLRLIYYRSELKKPPEYRFAEKLVDYFLQRHPEIEVEELDADKRRVIGEALGLTESTVRKYLRRLEGDVPAAISSHYRGHQKVFRIDLNQLSAFVSTWVPSEPGLSDESLQEIVERLSEGAEQFLTRVGLNSNFIITYIHPRSLFSNQNTEGDELFSGDNREKLRKTDFLKNSQFIPGKNLGQPSEQIENNDQGSIDMLLKDRAEGDIYKAFGEPSEKPGDLHEELLPIPKPDYEHCFVCLGSDGVELLELAGHKIPVCRDENCRRIFKKIEGLVRFIESKGGVVDYKTLENAGLMRTAMLCRSLCSVVKTDGFRYWIKRGERG